MQKRVGFLRAHLASETCRHGGRFLAALAVVHACFGQSDVRCRKPVRFCKSFACKSRGRNCSRQPGLAISLRGEAWLPCGNSGPVVRAEFVGGWSAAPTAPTSAVRPGCPAATAARDVELSLCGLVAVGDFVLLG